MPLKHEPEVQGEMTALFLRHEGYLGAVGAFLKAHPMEATETVNQGDTPKVRWCLLLSGCTAPAETMIAGLSGLGLQQRAGQ